MSKFEPDKPASRPGPEVDWGRIFRGDPFTCPKPADELDVKVIYQRYKKPLHFPMLAVGRYQVQPPEEIDQDTGEVTPSSYWEKRSGLVNGVWVDTWYPAMAHERAKMPEFQVFAKRELARNEPTRPNFQSVDDRAGKD